MTIRGMMLAAAWMVGALIAAAPASAQYYDEDGYEDRPRRYEGRRYYDEDRYDRRRYRRYGPGAGGSVCITARGNCAAPPAPFGASCGCMIPGFGYKRGAVGG